MTTSPPSLFPPQGITYFWMLNSDCSLDELQEQIHAFAQAGTSTLVLHARNGLLVPYAGRDWFELIETLSHMIADAGMKIWLYDEDYCPSGQAGGWIVAEHPEYRAQQIQRYQASTDLSEDQLFVFPMGKLLWAGAIHPDPSFDSIDMTDRVGVIRKHWETLLKFDSRGYYPTTPLHDCPRSDAVVPELAIRMPKLPSDYQMVAFVTAPCISHNYNYLVDSLNPHATEQFIHRTYDPYLKKLGPMFGHQVTAMFIDEPKYHGFHPWTPSLMDSFHNQFGYDLRLKLEDLFSDSENSSATLTRLHYRQWLGERFEQTWLKPVATWCEKHQLKVVGHMSPEDDLCVQAVTLSNLFPLQKTLDMPGLDLIIPAVGDAEHRIINVGVVGACSSAQQNNKSGVCSEMLAASGNELSTSQAARIMAWQVVNGVSNVVIHGAFASILGARRYDAPPNCGPNSRRWEAMQAADHGLRPFVDLVTRSRQVAPVAILWPIRSFQSQSWHHMQAAESMRDAFNTLLLTCLEMQVGTHILDETDLQNALIKCQTLRIGKAIYTHILLPPTQVLHQKTIDKLHQANQAGIAIYLCGDPPKWIQQDDQLLPCHDAPWDALTKPVTSQWLIEHLPRLLPLEATETSSLRATQWIKDGISTTLLMNLSLKQVELKVKETPFNLGPGELIALQQSNNGWQTAASFEPTKMPPLAPATPELELSDWRIRFDDEPWREISEPIAAYHFRPRGNHAIKQRSLMRGSAATDGEPVAKQLHYKASIHTNELSPRSILILEPTLARGCITIVLGSHQWQHKIKDTDTQPVRISLTEALADGDRELKIIIDNPMPFDGLHIAPILENRCTTSKKSHDQNSLNA